jgi:hypothetical protein
VLSFLDLTNAKSHARDFSMKRPIRHPQKSGKDTVPLPLFNAPLNPL